MDWYIVTEKERSNMTTTAQFLKEHPEIKEAISGCPETFCEALLFLIQHKFPKEEAYKQITEVLRAGTIPLPEDFPCSDACVEYGQAIAKHILQQNKNAVPGPKKVPG
jgi:hypothetical protein